MLACSNSSFEVAGNLELAFSQESLRDICESQLKAERALGLPMARALRARLADLRDAESVKDLVAGPPEVLESTPPGRIAIPLGSGACIFFSANHASTPVKRSGEVNWASVGRVKILEIGTTHD
jgi:hypothetical protein